MKRWLVFSALVAASLAPTPAAAEGLCTAEWAPVCAAKDGVQKTYSNLGCAKADGAEVVSEGPCSETAPQPTKPPIFCAETYVPVCGVKDGAPKTYANDCFARADDAKDIADGECAKP